MMMSRESWGAMRAVYRRGDCFRQHVDFVLAIDDVDCLACLHRVAGFAATRIGEPLVDVVFTFFESTAEPGFKLSGYILRRDKDKPRGWLYNWEGMAATRR